MARRRGIPAVAALRRTRATQAQAGLSNTGRRSNVAAAFRCRRGAQTLAGKRVLLIDDVMTTGSTAASCARALKQAGAAGVVLLTVARVDRRAQAGMGQTVEIGEGELI
jgi:predicted amidophosphoribosyltransferase